MDITVIILTLSINIILIFYSPSVPMGFAASSPQRLVSAPSRSTSYLPATRGRHIKNYVKHAKSQGATVPRFAPGTIFRRSEPQGPTQYLFNNGASPPLHDSSPSLSPAISSL